MCKKHMKLMPRKIYKRIRKNCIYVLYEKYVQFVNNLLNIALSTLSELLQKHIINSVLINNSFAAKLRECVNKCVINTCINIKISIAINYKHL